MIAAIDRAWAAGVFEGEGTVTISTGGRRGYTRSMVLMSNTDLDLIAFFHVRWPGCLSWHTNRQAHHRPAVQWSLNARKTIQVFLTPRVKTKIDLVLVDLAARVQGSRDPNYKAGCQERLLQMRVLNQRVKPTGIEIQPRPLNYRAFLAAEVFA